MIEYYQELLNECIDIQEHKDLMQKLNKKMKGVKEIMFGKHTDEGQKIKELEKIIRQKDSELAKSKLDMADRFSQIIEINEANSYGNESVKKRKINEICVDARYELLIGKIKTTYDQPKQ